jgi:hypothetical protein
MRSGEFSGNFLCYTIYDKIFKSTEKSVLFIFPKGGERMANEQNLRPFTSAQSREEAVKNGKKGGQNSGKAKRDKKMLKDCLEILMEKKTNIDGVNMTGFEALALSAFEKALSGDVKAMTFVRDTLGQKPVEKVVIADVEPSVIDEVESMVLGDDDAE